MRILILSFSKSEVSLCYHYKRLKWTCSQLSFLFAAVDLQDYVGDVIPLRQLGNSQLYFFQGETYRTIDLTVRNDSTPETHEIFVVELSNIQTFDIASTGQASLIPGKTTATISISASDRPHGVVELEAGSRLVDRTDEKNFTLTVSRLFGNIGKW